MHIVLTRIHRDVDTEGTKQVDTHLLVGAGVECRPMEESEVDLLRAALRDTSPLGNGRKQEEQCILPK